MIKALKIILVIFGQLLSLALLAGGVFATVLWQSSEFTDMTLKMYALGGIFGGLIFAAVMHMVSGFSIWSLLTFILRAEGNSIL